MKEINESAFVNRNFGCKVLRVELVNFITNEESRFVLSIFLINRILSFGATKTNSMMKLKIIRQSSFRHIPWDQFPWVHSQGTSPSDASERPWSQRSQIPTIPLKQSSLLPLPRHPDLLYACVCCLYYQRVYSNECRWQRLPVHLLGCGDNKRPFNRP
jgi:hypothetical protein